MKSTGDCGREEDDGAGQLLQALFEKDRLGYLGFFIQGLIHNINGPLQNMSMLVEIFEKSLESQDLMVRQACPELQEKWALLHEKQEKRCAQLQQQITVLADMMRDFMIVHELERSGTEIDLNLLLSKLGRVFRADLFFKHQVRLDLRLARNLPLVRIPGRHFVPSVVHIFRNCLTAMKGAERRELVVETRMDDDLIRVCFEDTGCGLGSGEDVESLFDLFHSRWPVREAELGRDEKHLGFGLYAARSLLAPYGVTLRLEPLPSGSRCVIEIPVRSK